jgi:probable HAF family extracellular repeat protein
MRRYSIFCLIQLVALGLILTVPSVVRASNFTQINFPGFHNTGALGINNAGSIVGEYNGIPIQSFGNVLGFLYQGGAYTTLEVRGSFDTYASGINDAGIIVGYYFDAQFNSHGFLYQGGTFTTLDFPGASSTWPLGINDAGSIVGNYLDDTGSRHYFLYQGGTFTTLDVPGRTGFYVGINDAGIIVGYYFDAQFNSHGFLYQGGAFTTLNFPGVPFAINDAGCIVGVSAGNPFLYQGGAFSTLDVPGGPDGPGTPFGINNAGSIVGSYVDATFSTQGFLISSYCGILVDPVPDLLNDLESQNFPALAVGGRAVQGVAADGVAELLIRIPAQSASDQFTLTLLDDQGNPISNTDTDNYGGLFDVGGTCCNSAFTVFAKDTSATGPPATAFALYRAPRDFVRLNNSGDATADHRTLTLKVESGGQIISQIPIKIVRPPVVLIHGIWSSPSTWDLFPLASDPRFKTYKVDYRQFNWNLIDPNTVTVDSYLSGFLDDFKFNSQVAAVQFDVVAHSMGGLIARNLTTYDDFLNKANYHSGNIHKLLNFV